MNRKKIGILFGGSSSEYEISLKSAYGIISHIDRKRYEPVLLGITREGTWFLYQGILNELKMEAGIVSQPVFRQLFLRIADFRESFTCRMGR